MAVGRYSQSCLKTVRATASAAATTPGAATSAAAGNPGATSARAEPTEAHWSADAGLTTKAARIGGAADAHTRRAGLAGVTVGALRIRAAKLNLGSIGRAARRATRFQGE